MKRSILLFIVLMFGLNININAQNSNENIDNDVVYTGAIDDEAFEASLPEMVLTAESVAKSIPSSVDNSARIYMPPIFNQRSTSSCAQCAEIGYVLTYELNRYRNVAAGTSWEGNGEANENLYHPFFTYNFLNNGSMTNGTMLGSGFQIVAENGCPSLVDYWNPILGNLNNPDASRYWMNGGEKYINATENTNLYENNISPFKITWSTSLSSLDNLKRWLSNHNSDSDEGGLAIISVLVTTGYSTINIPNGSPESGKKMVSSWGTTGRHALTIVGYNDNIHCFDLNNDGVYQNVDTNGNGIIDLNECEKGAFKIANSWGNHYTTTNGYVYVPYKLMAEISNKRAYTCIASEPKDKEIFLSFKMAHPKRNKMRIYVGTGDNIGDLTPDASSTYAIFNAQGGEYPMNGMSNNAQPIYVALNFSEKYTGNEIIKYFIEINDTSTTNYGTGQAYVEELKLIDYRWNEEFVLNSDCGKVTIDNNTNTVLSVDYDLIPFNGYIKVPYTCATNKVMRREVFVTNSSSFTINNGVKLDLYGTEDYDCKLIIDSNSDLIIGDSVIINAKSGDCEIIINGNAEIGENVCFSANNNASLKIKVLNRDGLNINNCTFNNVNLEIDASTVGNNNEIGIVNITNNSFIFSKNSTEYAIKLKDYNNFSIINNSISGIGFDEARHLNDGILLYYSGTQGSGNIQNNNIIGCTETGLTVYNSNCNISLNKITSCGYGVKLLNSSTINNFIGNCGSLNPNYTQYIHDNDICEINIHHGSMPQNIEYNVITTSKSGALIQYVDNAGAKAYNIIVDIEDNNWGTLSNAQIENKFVYITNTNNSATFNYEPKWSLGVCDNEYEDVVKQMSLEADSLWSIGEYDLAETKYKDIISEYPTTHSAENAMKKLLILEGNSDNDYESLQTYYRNNNSINSNDNLSAIGDFLANKCDENLENYSEAIAWYESVIEDETTPFNDSIFATIDLGNLYLKMDGNRIKGIQGKLTQFIPKSREDHSLRTDYALRLLDNNSNKSTKYHELTGYYWTDHVTEQPEGFDIDDNGNVSISTREGLVWLVSTVNGLNGQEPNDYEGLVVTLNDDLHDLDYYTWVPIGTSDNPFRGTFDGQNFIIDAIYMEDSEEGTNFGLFGTLDSAVIKRVTLGDRCIIYSYENSGGIAYLADNNTIIDECYVSVNMSVNNTSGGIVCINRDSKISNCCFNPYSYEIDGSYNGGIAGQNISVNSDAIIENSYVVTLFLEDEYYSHTAGIVGKNITESNNHKAIIRNCYAVPLYLQGEGCSGITSYNSENSIIENCYTNRDFDLCTENYGEIINCTVFDEDLQFDEIIEVFDVSASELTTALNLWTNHNPYNGRYLSWKYISDAMNYGYPILYPYPPLPEYYWTDLVTSQPEGYDVDESGNIHIYTAEALAWVSVLSNGLHGNEVEDFEGLTITLEKDIDLSGAKWSPIGGMEVMSEVYPFRGTFNGNNKVINNVILTNAPGNKHSNGFFRLLEGAHVCDVIMKDAYYEGNIMDGGFFAYSCENSKISRCLVECSYSILGGSMSLFINKVNSSIIHDCVMMAPLVFDGYDQTVCGTFVGYNNEGSHIYNCVSIVDRMCWTEGIGLVGYHNLGKIENCHVYIKEIIGYPGYGGGPGPRNGITEYNYGEILNCYYNCDIYSEEWGSTIISDLDNLPAYHNSGIIENTCSYIKEDGYCKLSESIVYNGNSTDNLLEALEFGVEELVQNGYKCEDWCETSLIFDNLGLPFVCTFSEITNIDENSTDSDLMAIYPNPTENNITIEAEDIIQIEVYNTLGQMVARIGAEGNSVELDMSDYSDGIYLIKTVSKEGSTVSRVVKM